MGQGFDIEYLFVVENICGHKYFCIIFIKEFDVYHCLLAFCKISHIVKYSILEFPLNIQKQNFRFNVRLRSLNSFYN